PWQPEPPARAVEPESRPAPAPLPQPTHFPWFLWVGLSMAAGLGLRFVQLPDFAVPMIVGLAVTAGVTLVLHLAMKSAEDVKPPPTPTGRGEPQRPVSRHSF